MFVALKGFPDTSNRSTLLYRSAAVIPPTIVATPAVVA
eukprot:COSAG02_NODE_37793_length_437_cov_1.062130_1_plen_37_part_10